MRWIYTLLLYLIVPFAMLRLLWRSRKLPTYRYRMKERFGFNDLAKRLSAQGTSRQTIWVHAVSVGEVLAAIPFIKSLQARYPDRPIVLTTTTPTGSERVTATFNDSVFHVYAPFDLPGAVQRFLKSINPAIAIMMETELWPNTFYYCDKKNIPIVVANARLASKSARGYSRIYPLVRDMLVRVKTLAAQSPEDAERFIALGSPNERVKTLGNIKFDLQIPHDLLQRANELRQTIAADRPVWIAASTHAGEEDYVLNAFKEILIQHPNLLLVLVPRHPDRFDEVAQLCESRSFSVARRSREQTCDANTQIYLGDTMGELVLLYGVADVVFVGGSLVPIGGHNLLEPAALSKASITGPHMHNFIAITDMLKSAHAILQIQTPTGLATAVMDFLRDPEGIAQMGARGQEVLMQNQGALAKHMDVVEQVLADIA